MFLSIFIHSNQFFPTITKSFYIALSHINIRTRNEIAAVLLIIRACGGHPRIFEIFSEKISQCQKLSHSAKNTLFHILIHALPILIHRLGFRLSAPYLNTCIAYVNILTRLHILILAFLIH